MRDQMALDANGWLTRGTLKQRDQQTIYVTTEKLLAQAEQTNRFTQTDRGNYCAGASMQQEQHPTIYTQIEKKDCDTGKGPDQGGGGNIAVVSADDKACYRFDVPQPFTYNYAFVNQMSLAASTFKCDQCGSTFNQAPALHNHKKVMHGLQHDNNRCDAPVNGVESPLKKLGKKKKFSRCEEGSNFSNAPISSSSATLGGSDQKPPIYPVKRKNALTTVTKCHKCNGSGIILIGVPSRHHHAITEKPFQCTLCEGRFSRYSSLWSHRRLHSGDKPFKCEACGLTFAKAAYLKNHLRVHTGEKPYKCSICGLQFSQSPHLKNHERIHSGEKPYQCEVCDKTFARHSTLWNHRRIHTGEKPYRCDTCGSAFNQATHLKNHLKVHTGEKPHHCEVCKVGFSDRFALKRHRKIHDKYAQPFSNRQPQLLAAQQPAFKYDVSGPIAFPGCRPQEQK